MRRVRKKVPLHIDMWESAWVSEPDMYHLITTRILDRYLFLAQAGQIRDVPNLHVLLIPALDSTQTSLTLSSVQNGVRYLSLVYPRDLGFTPTLAAELDDTLVKTLKRYKPIEHSLTQKPDSVSDSTVALKIETTLSQLGGASPHELALSGDAPPRLVRRDKLIPNTASSSDAARTYKGRLAESVHEFCEVMYSAKGADDPVDLGLTALRYARLSRPVLNRAFFPRRIARGWEYCDALSRYFERGDDVPEPVFVPTSTSAPLSVALVPSGQSLVAGYGVDVDEQHAREFHAQVMLWKEHQLTRTPFGDPTADPLKGLKVPLARELLKYLSQVEGMPIGSTCVAILKVLWSILHEEHPQKYAAALLAEFSRIREATRAHIGQLSCKGTLLTNQDLETALLLVGLTTPQHDLKREPPRSVPFENYVAVYDLERAVQYVAGRNWIELKGLLPGFPALWTRHGTWMPRY